MKLSLSNASPEHTGGIVLCGGRSSRMGRAKHLLPFGEQTMLQVVVETLRSVVSPVVVVRAEGQELPELLDDVLVAEDEEPHLGPLAGLCTGLTALAERCESAFVASCDAPLLKREVIQYLIASRGDRDAAVVRDGTNFHVLAAVYSLRLLPPIRERLRDRRLRLRELIDASDDRIVDAHDIRRLDPELHSFRNANTPDEYAELLRIAQRS
jgi:molybdopterin-guanine dinucleotide biosynthesis protein A